MDNVAARLADDAPPDAAPAPGVSDAPAWADTPVAPPEADAARGKLRRAACEAELAASLAALREAQRRVCRARAALRRQTDTGLHGVAGRALPALALAAAWLWRAVRGSRQRALRRARFLDSLEAAPLDGSATTGTRVVMRFEHARGGDLGMLTRHVGDARAPGGALLTVLWDSGGTTVVPAAHVLRIASMRPLSRYYFAGERVAAANASVALQHSPDQRRFGTTVCGADGAGLSAFLYGGEVGAMLGGGRGGASSEGRDAVQVRWDASADAPALTATVARAELLWCGYPWTG